MFEKDIAEGIKILNRHDLGWAHRINVDELDMSEYPKGIIGQLYGHNEDGEIFCKVMKDYGENETFCGFTILDAETDDPQWGLLTREWQRIIRRIQKIPSDEPFEVEVVRML